MKFFNAGVVKLVDTPDSKSGFFGSAGSIPALGTIEEFHNVLGRTLKPAQLLVFLCLMHSTETIQGIECSSVPRNAERSRMNSHAEHGN